MLEKKKKKKKMGSGRKLYKLGKQGEGTHRKIKRAFMGPALKDYFHSGLLHFSGG